MGLRVWGLGTIAEDPEPLTRLCRPLHDVATTSESNQSNVSSLSTLHKGMQGRPILGNESTGYRVKRNIVDAWGLRRGSIPTINTNKIFTTAKKFQANLCSPFKEAARRRVETAAEAAFVQVCDSVHGDPQNIRIREFARFRS